MAIKVSKDLRTFDDIDEWLARLNREWPERHQVARHIADQVAGLGVDRPLVVELAAGSGYLTAFLLRALPDIRYVGFDRSPYLLDYARKKVGTLAGHVESGAEIHLRQFDLNEREWIDWLQEEGMLGAADAVVSLQSLHDLGGEAEQQRAFARARQVLRPGGVFLNADLLLDPNDPHPRRLPAYRHLDLLRAANFTRVDCTRRIGAFGCFVGYAPEG